MELQRRLRQMFLGLDGGLDDLIAQCVGMVVVPQDWNGRFFRQGNKNSTMATIIFATSPLELIDWLADSYKDKAPLIVAEILADLAVYRKDPARFVQIFFAASDKWPERPWPALLDEVKSYRWSLDKVRVNLARVNKMLSSDADARCDNERQGERDKARIVLEMTEKMMDLFLPLVSPNEVMLRLVWELTQAAAMAADCPLSEVTVRVV